jgi:hypothetical protein
VFDAGMLLPSTLRLRYSYVTVSLLRYSYVTVSLLCGYTAVALHDEDVDLLTCPWCLNEVLGCFVHARTCTCQCARYMRI